VAIPAICAGVPAIKVVACALITSMGQCHQAAMVGFRNTQ
jgi:hypothetical protein